MRQTQSPASRTSTRQRSTPVSTGPATDFNGEDTPSPFAENQATASAPSVPPRTRQKRIQPSRSRRGGPGVGSCELDVVILDALKRHGENEPLVPSTTAFVLTTNSSLVPEASTSADALEINSFAFERYFDRPEVIKRVQSQHGIETPECIQVSEEALVGTRLRARGNEEESADTSDAAYEKRHKKYETFEKRQRLREREKLQHAHYKLKERIDQLRGMDASAFLLLDDAYFPQRPFASAQTNGYIPSSASSSTSVFAFSEGERRRQAMLEVAQSLEERYQALLPRKGTTAEKVPVEKVSNAPKNLAQDRFSSPTKVSAPPRTHNLPPLPPPPPSSPERPLRTTQMPERRRRSLRTQPPPPSPPPPPSQDNEFEPSPLQEPAPVTPPAMEPDVESEDETLPAQDLVPAVSPQPAESISASQPKSLRIRLKIPQQAAAEPEQTPSPRAESQPAEILPEPPNEDAMVIDEPEEAPIVPEVSMEAATLEEPIREPTPSPSGMDNQPVVPEEALPLPPSTSPPPREPSSPPREPSPPPREPSPPPAAPSPPAPTEPPSEPAAPVIENPPSPEPNPEVEPPREIEVQPEPEPEDALAKNEDFIPETPVESHIETEAEPEESVVEAPVPPEPTPEAIEPPPETQPEPAPPKIQPEPAVEEPAEQTPEPATAPRPRKRQRLSGPHAEGAQPQLQSPFAGMDARTRKRQPVLLLAAWRNVDIPHARKTSRTLTAFGADVPAIVTTDKVNFEIPDWALPNEDDASSTGGPPEYLHEGPPQAGPSQRTPSPSASVGDPPEYPSLSEEDRTFATELVNHINGVSRAPESISQPGSSRRKGAPPGNAEVDPAVHPELETPPIATLPDNS